MYYSLIAGAPHEVDIGKMPPESNISQKMKLMQK